jgi:putative ABC transport system permease protein
MLYGAPWSLADENAAKDVVVISRSLSEKIFGAGTNPVGKTIRFDDSQWTITGVADTWKPMPRYYRLINGNGGSFVGTEDMFVPFQTGDPPRDGQQRQQQLQRRRPQEPGWQGWIESSATSSSSGSRASPPPTRRA